MASQHLCGLEEWVQDSASPFTPPTTLPISQVSLFPPLELRLCNYSHPQKKEGVNLRAQCEGQMGACSISQRFWVFVLGEQDLWVQSDKAQQHPPGYLQSEVQVYCLLPGGERPSVIDLFRSHHWEKNPGAHYLAISPMHLPRAPAPQAGRGAGWRRGHLLPWDTAERHRVISSISFRSWLGREDTAAFSAKPGASFQWF